MNDMDLDFDEKETDQNTDFLAADVQMEATTDAVQESDAAGDISAAEYISRIASPQNALRDLLMRCYLYRLPVVACFNLPSQKRGWYQRYDDAFAKRTIDIIEKYPNRPFGHDEPDQILEEVALSCAHFAKLCEQESLAYFYIIMAPNNRIIYDTAYAKKKLNAHETTDIWNAMQISSGVCGLRSPKIDPVKEIIMTQAGMSYPPVKDIEIESDGDLGIKF